jgi:hypothetical protein
MTAKWFIIQPKLSDEKYKISYRLIPLPPRLAMRAAAVIAVLLGVVFHHNLIK